MPLCGWRVNLYDSTGTVLLDSTFTDCDGLYQFLVDRDGTQYVVKAIPPPPGFFPAGSWVNTTFTSGLVTANTNRTGVDFGNVCLGAGGGRTLGFWSNKNGQALLTSGDFAGANNNPTSSMMLDVNHLSVGDGAFVYAPAAPGANGFGFISIHTLLAQAIANLTGSNRSLQETIKTALDRANNNITFVQPVPCAFTTPY